MVDMICVVQKGLVIMNINTYTLLAHLIRRATPLPRQSDAAEANLNLNLNASPNLPSLDVHLFPPLSPSRSGARENSLLRNRIAPTILA